MATGKSVRLFLVDGTSGGLTTAEIMNWTGHVVAASRTDLPKLLKRPETQRTGVYFLLGEDSEGTGDPAAYIGEGDDVRKRLAQHNQPEDRGGKDFWTRVVVLTSKDTNLTKAHVRYLEARFLAIAGQAARSRMTNGTTPAPLPLPESDQSDMEYFIEQAKIILPVLGVNILRTSIQEPAPPQIQIPAETTTGAPPKTRPQDWPDSPVFEMTIKRAGVHATAQEVDGEFVVRSGSIARTEPTSEAMRHIYIDIQEALLLDGTLQPHPTDPILATFTRDHVFSSPSGAATIVAGRQSNGRTEWVESQTGLTYGAWQDERAKRALAESEYDLPLEEELFDTPTTRPMI